MSLHRDAVAPTIVATASHCTARRRPNNVSFGTGQDPGSPEATFAVAEIHEHPNVDAALLILELMQPSDYPAGP